MGLVAANDGERRRCHPYAHAKDLSRDTGFGNARLDKAREVYIFNRT